MTDDPLTFALHGLRAERRRRLADRFDRLAEQCAGAGDRQLGLVWRTLAVIVRDTIETRRSEP